MMDGLVLVVIGAVFAYGWTAREDRQVFALMGMALGMIFLAIYLVLMGANRSAS
jgi:hypothetical protein